MSLAMRAMLSAMGGAAAASGSAGSSSLILTSSQGTLYSLKQDLTLTKLTLPIASVNTNNSLQGCQAANGVLLIQASYTTQYRIYISKDKGLTWIDTGCLPNQVVTGFFYWNNLYWIVTTSGNNGGSVFNSPDAVTWTNLGSKFGTDTFNYSYLLNGIFTVPVWNSGFMYTSSDGNTFSRHGGNGGIYDSFIYDPDLLRYYALTNDGGALYSSNGVSYSYKAAGMSGGWNLSKISGYYYAMSSGSNGLLYRTPSFETPAWTSLQVTETGRDIRTFADMGGKIYVPGKNYIYQVSADFTAAAPVVSTYLNVSSDNWKAVTKV